MVMTARPEQAPAPRAPGNEVAGAIAIWTGPGVIGDTGAATVPGALTVTGAATFNSTVTVPAPAASPAGDMHAVNRAWVVQEIADATTAAGALPDVTPSTTIYGRGGTPTPSWQAVVPLAGGVTMTGALTVPTVTISVALNLPGGETAASQTWVTSAITNAIAALTIAGLPSALMTELDNRYVRRAD